MTSCVTCAPHTTCICTEDTIVLCKNRSAFVASHIEKPTYVSKTKKFLYAFIELGRQERSPRFVMQAVPDETRV